MSKPRSITLDELLPGMQLAFFDTVWPAFQWIQSIWVKAGTDQFHLFVVATAEQDEKEWEDFDYLAGAVFKSVERALDEREPTSKHKIEYRIQNGLTVPQDDGYRELMSDRVFKNIAKRIAPWRLENGR
jgi:hypothetical protein